MSALCDLVRSELSRTNNGDGVIWEVRPETDTICQASSGHIRIRFALDPRNQLIESTISFSSNSEESDEEMTTYVLSRLFPSMTFRRQSEGLGLDRRVALETGNVVGLLAAIRNSNISPKELQQFYRGYNAGYTDSVSF